MLPCHPVHQLTRARSARRRQVVARVPQVVEVEPGREAGHPDACRAILFTCNDVGCPKPCQNSLLQVKVSEVVEADGVPVKTTFLVIGTDPGGTSMTLVVKPVLASNVTRLGATIWQLLKSGTLTGNLAELVAVSRT